jgi:hypothetical protein
MTTIDGRTGERIDPPTRTFRKPTTYSSGSDFLDGSGDPELMRQVNVPKAFTPPPLSSYQVDALLERGAHYSVIDSVSPKCAKAWGDVERAFEGAREALERRDGLEHEAKDAKRAASQAVQEAVAAGKPVKPVEIPEFTARREALEIEARARYDHARTLQARYLATYQAELAPSLERLVAEIEPARAAAREAWQAAQAPLSRLHNVLTVADLLQRKLDPDDLSGRTSAEGQRLANGAPGALATLGAWLTSSDPVVSGSRFTSPSEVRPPLHAREALWNSERHADVVHLAEIEFGERYAVTDHTRREYEHHFRRAE